MAAIRVWLLKFSGLKGRDFVTARHAPCSSGELDTARKTVLFYDLSGFYTHLAEAVVGEFANVLYFSQWERAFSLSRDAMPGYGLEGIERVEDFFEATNRADLVVFPDVGMVGLQQQLRDQGMPVWGSGKGARLERDRWFLRTIVDQCGLDTSIAMVIKGLDQLRELLRESEECFIKMSNFRGDMETFHHETYFETQSWLDELASKLGGFQTICEFIVEQPIQDEDGEACEVGIDAMVIDGKLMTPALWGYEVKDSAYLGMVGAVPARLMEVHQKIQPLLEGINYRGPMSNEVRFTREDAYLIDFTARFPSPPSEVQSQLISNIGEVMWDGAQGLMPKPQYKGVYAAQVVLNTKWAKEQYPKPAYYLGLEIGRRDRVRIHHHCRIDGHDYSISPSDVVEFGAAVGFGDSLEEAVGDALDAAESVNGYQVHYDANAFSKAADCIRNGEKLGIVWGGMKEAA